MADEKFKRYELKYLVTDDQRAIIEKIFEDYMIPDEFGPSRICNIYYDTPDYRLIRRSLEHPEYKEKLRSRCYGCVEPDSKIFLELKKKYNGIVYKRRIKMKVQDCEDYLSGKIPIPDRTQIGREIDYFVNFYTGIQPAFHISYERTAYFGKDDHSFRVSFDRNILWRNTDLSLTKEPDGTAILDPGQSIMEIKASDAIPLWLVDILSTYHLKKTSFSKVGRAYESILRKTLMNKEENIYD